MSYAAIFLKSYFASKSFYKTKLMDSMLPCLCSVIDHKDTKCGKNISHTLVGTIVLSANFLFLPHSGIICSVGN